MLIYLPNEKAISVYKTLKKLSQHKLLGKKNREVLTWLVEAIQLEKVNQNFIRYAEEQRDEY